MKKTSVFQKDLYRYYGDRKETLRERLFRPIELRYIKVLRRAQASSNPFCRAYYKLRLRRLAEKSHIQIPVSTQIGEGFYIGHTGRVVINPNAKLGKNINLGTGVTIGQENRGERKGVPTLSDNVWVGTNAVLVGKITIGTDVLIAPLTFVNFDVPPHSIVVGNPAKIIHRENATEGYLNKTV